MISVAIATYNGEQYILKQLQSIATQTRLADEVIISDDASKDNTVSIIRDFIKENNLINWILLENKCNHGFNFNFFNALDNTHGDIVFLSDQDDKWLPNKVEVMAHLMEENTSWMMLSSSYSVINANGVQITSKNVINAMEEDDGSLYPVTVNSQIACSYLRGCAMCLRRKVITMADRKNLSSILGHDWILGITASLLGDNYILHQKLFEYRYHGNNTSLSSVTRTDLIGDTNTRIFALEQSAKAHKFLLSNFKNANNFTITDQNNMKKMIRFENKRLRFLKNHNFFTWLQLIFYISKYKRYYKSLVGAFKVYVGDFLYAYNINFKVR